MHRLIALIVRYGTPLVWFNVFLEQIGLPIPAVPTLVLAGALSRDGKMSSTALIFGAVIASLAADSVWFLLGRRLGNRVLRTICRISLSPDSCVRDTEARFERWGMPSLLFAKFVPGFSTIAPPLAGATNHSAIEFVLYDVAGAFLWAGASVAAGRVFHRAVDRLLLGLENLGYWAVVLVVCALGIVISAKWWQRHRFLRQLRLARISPSELLQLIEGKRDPLVFDVRTASGHRRDPRRIPAAIVIPADRIPEHVADIARNREIILYCT
ncbi:MAG: DedA family protein/thiosulfate sulfurtransferase GlpE [Thermoanaerobaculia bacterium]